MISSGRHIRDSEYTSGMERSNLRILSTRTFAVYILPLTRYPKWDEVSTIHKVSEVDKEGVVHTILPSKTGQAGREEGQKDACRIVR